MNNKKEKPRLVYFRFPLNGASEVKKIHEQLYFDALDYFFNVTLVEYDCDFREICDQFHPDLALFESGKSLLHRRIKIHNAKNANDVPKVGLIRSDPYCGSRPIFAADMENWGVETFFANKEMLPNHFEDIKDNTYLWPRFFDPTMFYDYQQVKSVPITMSGIINKNRPWRLEIDPILKKQFPVLSLPHLGHVKSSESHRMVYGSRYAKTLNRSWISVADGTSFQYLVKKHLEVPASKCILLTEKTPILEIMGFRDMENCIFATPSDVVQKLDYLFDHPDWLEKIAQSGYKFVHENHSFKNRSQIFQWFQLNQSIHSNQRIVQTGLLEPLSVVEKSYKIKNVALPSNSVVGDLLAKGYDSMKSQDYLPAINYYKKCLEYVEYMPEPLLKVGICYLYLGRPDLAIPYISYPSHWRSRVLGCEAKDPVECSYMILAMLCQRKMDLAVKQFKHSKCLHHTDMLRMKYIFHYLGLHGHGHHDTNKAELEFHFGVSVHTERLRFTSWLVRVITILRSCGQVGLANTVSQILESQEIYSSQKDDDLVYF